MNIAMFGMAIVGTGVCAVLGLLFFAGAVNSRAEEEYWSEYWQDTPTIDARIGGDQTEAVPLKRAA